MKKFGKIKDFYYIHPTPAITEIFLFFLPPRRCYCVPFAVVKTPRDYSPLTLRMNVCCLRLFIFHISCIYLLRSRAQRLTWLLCRKVSRGTNNNWNKTRAILRRGFLLPRELGVGGRAFRKHLEICWHSQKKTSSRRFHSALQSWFVFHNIALSALPAFAFIARIFPRRLTFDARKDSPARLLFTINKNQPIPFERVFSARSCFPSPHCYPMANHHAWWKCFRQLPLGANHALLAP